MKTKHLYLVLALLGVVLPYSQLLPWIAEHGFDIALLIEQITASRVAAFGWLDAGVSGLVLLVFLLTEGRERRVPHLWLPIAGIFLVGVSFGFPVFMYLRGLAQ